VLREEIPQSPKVTSASPPLSPTLIFQIIRNYAFKEVFLIEDNLLKGEGERNFPL